MPDSPRWIVYALLGAFFAACVQVTSKPAGDKLGENTVSLLRASVMQVFFVCVVAYEMLMHIRVGNAPAAATTNPNAPTIAPGYGWATALAVASGVAASLSWFFGYKALKLSAVSKSYPIDKLSVAMGVILAVIFLGDRPSLTNWLGIAVMIGGAYLVTLKAS